MNEPINCKGTQQCWSYWPKSGDIRRHNGWFWEISSKNCLTMDCAQNRLWWFKKDLKSSLHICKGQKGQHIIFLIFKDQNFAKMIFNVYFRLCSTTWTYYTCQGQYWIFKGRKGRCKAKCGWNSKLAVHYREFLFF